MIPAGRSAIDRAGIAELHGLSWRQARRARPWAQPEHPAPLTRGRPARGKPQLWDQQQAAEFAHGEPVTALPTDSAQDGDLLDYVEAAHWAGVDPVAWTRDTYRDRAPAADEHLFGGSFWYRATVDAYREHREQPARRGGGRPTGTREHTPRAELPGQVQALLQEAHDSGEPISTADIARRLGIHYTTAHRHVTAIRNASRY